MHKYQHDGHFNAELFTMTLQLIWYLPVDSECAIVQTSTLWSLNAWSMSAVDSFRRLPCSINFFASCSQQCGSHQCHNNMQLQNCYSLNSTGAVSSYEQHASDFPFSLSICHVIHKISRVRHARLVLDMSATCQTIQHI